MSMYWLVRNGSDGECSKKKSRRGVERYIPKSKTGYMNRWFLYFPYVPFYVLHTPMRGPGVMRKGSHTLRLVLMKGSCIFAFWVVFPLIEWNVVDISGMWWEYRWSSNPMAIRGRRKWTMCRLSTGVYQILSIEQFDTGLVAHTCITYSENCVGSAARVVDQRP